MGKKVSVILPVHNVEEYLKECLERIVNQTLKDIEIICIDDGSTDNSPGILNEFKSKDDRIVVVSRQNQGQGIARNRGISLANGEYIQFVDPDDFVELNMLEVLYNFAKENNSKIVKFNYYNYNDYSGELKKIDFVSSIKKDFDYDLTKNPHYSRKDLKSGCLTKLDLHVWSHFYSTEFIKSNNIVFAPNKHGEDHLFVNSAMLIADKTDFLNEYLYYYRIRNGSSFNKKSDDNFCIFDNIKLLEDFTKEHSLFDELKDEIRSYAQLVIDWHYNSIPKNSVKKYESLARQYFGSEIEFKNFLRQKKKQRSFIENIFSIKNKFEGPVKYKAITVLGCTFLMKTKKGLKQL